MGAKKHRPGNAARRGQGENLKLIGARTENNLVAAYSS